MHPDTSFDTCNVLHACVSVVVTEHASSLPEISYQDIDAVCMLYSSFSVCFWAADLASAADFSTLFCACSAVLSAFPVNACHHFFPSDFAAVALDSLLLSVSSSVAVVVVDGVSG